MKYTALCRDARLRLFVFVAGILASVAFILDEIRDRLNGDVDSVISKFDSMQARLSRAEAADRKAIYRLNARADNLQVQIDATEAAIDAREERATRATRVQQRIAALLD